ncbi:MAG: hypothetical protein HQM12_22785 [SAR324 cluster bacterium]|nr:hypothetical protein [SAR324 cluster bacterium]
MKNNKGTKKHVFIVVMLVLAFLMGCGEMNSETFNVTAEDAPSNIGDKEISTSDETGTLLVGLTDADGDFLTYTVDVKSLSLTKTDGAQVEVLPLSSRIDFAQYTNMTELLTAATVPPGKYVSGKMTLDYSNAEILVELNGVSRVATMLNSDGTSLNGDLSMEMQLSGDHPLVIVPGVPSHLQLDFDLEATNAVDLSSGTPVVTVTPMLVTEINPTNLKDNRIRGLFKSTDTAAGTFELQVRPLWVKSGDFGAITIHTSTETTFEIDGTAFNVESGLQALAEKDSTTGVIVVGTLDIETKTIQAAEVYVGSSVPDGTLDVVRGSVIDRDGDQIVVMGAAIVRSNGSCVFNDHVTIDLTNLTKVNKQLSRETVSKDEILPGTLLWISGTLEENTDGFVMSAPQTARIQMSYLSGTVQGVASGSLVLDTKEINQRRSSVYDISSINALTVNTSNLDVSALENGSLIRVKGFFNAGEIFSAQTLIDVSNVAITAKIDWKEQGSNQPFVSADASSIAIDMTREEFGKHHHLFPANNDLASYGNTFTIVPTASGTGVFVIGKARTLQTFTDFANFVEALNQKFENAINIKTMIARGAFDAETNTLTVAEIRVILETTKAKASSKAEDSALEEAHAEKQPKAGKHPKAGK